MFLCGPPVTCWGNCWPVCLLYWFVLLSLSIRFQLPLSTSYPWKSKVLSVYNFSLKTLMARTSWCLSLEVWSTRIFESHVVSSTHIWLHWSLHVSHCTMDCSYVGFIIMIFHTGVVFGVHSLKIVFIFYLRRRLGPSSPPKSFRKVEGNKKGRSMLQMKFFSLDLCSFSTF